MTKTGFSAAADIYSSTLGLTAPPAQTYLFFIFFFLGESSSEAFLALPLDARFSLSPRDSPSVEIFICIHVQQTVLSHDKKAFSDPTYFSVLFPLYFRSHSLPVSPLAHSQTAPDLHPVYGYVCPPAVKGFHVD